MIDKLDTHESKPLVIVEKLNELIDAYNKLEKKVKGQAYENDPLNRIG